MHQSHNSRKQVMSLKKNALLPEDCIMDFDFRLIDLFEKMDRSSIKIEKLLVEEYERIKAELGHRPSRTELFTYMDETIYLNLKSKAKINPFKNYLNFLKNQNDLSDEEIAWLDTPAVKLYQYDRENIDVKNI